MNYYTFLYLYFDAQERAVKNRIINIQNRILFGREFSSADVIDLYNLKIRLEVLNKIETDLLEMFENE